MFSKELNDIDLLDKLLQTNVGGLYCMYVIGRGPNTTRILGLDDTSQMTRVIRGRSLVTCDMSSNLFLLHNERIVFDVNEYILDFSVNPRMKSNGPIQERNWVTSNFL
jgi:hypothetical protein